MGWSDARSLRHQFVAVNLSMDVHNAEELEPITSRLTSYFAGKPGVQAAWLFGSHCAGRSHRESDLDVAVLLSHARYSDPRARFDARIRITSDIIGLLHRNEIDLVVLNDAPPRFARLVVLEGRRIHRADAEAEHAFRRDVQLRAADLAPFLDRMLRLKMEALPR